MPGPSNKTTPGATNKVASVALAGALTAASLPAASADDARGIYWTPPPSAPAIEVQKDTSPNPALVNGNFSTPGAPPTTSYTPPTSFPGARPSIGAQPAAPEAPWTAGAQIAANAEELAVLRSENNLQAARNINKRLIYRDERIDMAQDINRSVYRNRQIRLDGQGVPFRGGWMRPTAGGFHIGSPGSYSIRQPVTGYNSRQPMSFSYSLGTDGMLYPR